MKDGAEARRDAAHLRRPEGRGESTTTTQCQWRRPKSQPPDEGQILVVIRGDTHPAQLEGRCLYLLDSRRECAAQWKHVSWWSPMPPSPPR